MKPIKPLAWRKRAIQFLSNERRPHRIAPGDSRFAVLGRSEVVDKFNAWRDAKYFVVGQSVQSPGKLRAQLKALRSAIRVAAGTVRPAQGH